MSCPDRELWRTACGSERGRVGGQSEVGQSLGDGVGVIDAGDEPQRTAAALATTDVGG